MQGAAARSRRHGAVFAAAQHACRPHGASQLTIPSTVHLKPLLCSSAYHSGTQCAFYKAKELCVLNSASGMHNTKMKSSLRLTAALHCRRPG